MQIVRGAFAKFIEPKNLKILEMPTIHMPPGWPRSSSENFKRLDGRKKWRRFGEGVGNNPGAKAGKLKPHLPPSNLAKPLSGRGCSPGAAACGRRSARKPRRLSSATRNAPPSQIRGLLEPFRVELLKFNRPVLALPLEFDVLCIGQHHHVEGRGRK